MNDVEILVGELGEAYRTLIVSALTWLHEKHDPRDHVAVVRELLSRVEPPRYGLRHQRPPEAS